MGVGPFNEAKREMMKRPNIVTRGTATDGTKEKDKQTCNEDLQSTPTPDEDTVT